jgi:hypothetical protein
VKTLMHRRKSYTVNPADPTVVTRHEFLLGRLTVTLVEFFGDVTMKITWNGRERLFTSKSIHPWLNKVATYIYDRCEDRHNASHQGDGPGDWDVRAAERAAGWDPHP